MCYNSCLIRNRQQINYKRQYRKLKTQLAASKRSIGIDNLLYKNHNPKDSASIIPIMAKMPKEKKTLKIFDLKPSCPLFQEQHSYNVV